MDRFFWQWFAFFLAGAGAWLIAGILPSVACGCFFWPVIPGSVVGAVGFAVLAAIAMREGRAERDDKIHED